MTTDTIATTYPEWQATIRKAQAERNEQRRQADEEHRAYLAKKFADSAEKFQKLLASCGIAVAIEDVQGLDKGGVPFINAFGYKFQFGNEYQQEYLYVFKPVPNADETLAVEMWDYDYSYLTELSQGIAVNTSNIQAEMADVLDALERYAVDQSIRNAELVEIYNHRKAKAAKVTEVTAPEPTPSLSDQLEDLIRQIVREEIGAGA